MKVVKPDSMIGRKFGRLTVLSFLGMNRNGKSIWACRCSCGTVTSQIRINLTSGNTRSCGCLVPETTRTNFFKHGHAHTVGSYSSWQAMWTRCTNPKQPSWKYYGARGIKVCRRWRKFENFLADMGERPKGKTIDRIKSDKPYSPRNCRWATPREQTLNRRKKAA